MKHFSYKKKFNMYQWNMCIYILKSAILPNYYVESPYKMFKTFELSNGCLYFDALDVGKL